MVQGWRSIDAPSPTPGPAPPPLIPRKQGDIYICIWVIYRHVRCIRGVCLIYGVCIVYIVCIYGVCIVYVCCSIDTSEAGGYNMC